MCRVRPPPCPLRWEVPLLRTPALATCKRIRGGRRRQRRGGREARRRRARPRRPHTLPLCPSCLLHTSATVAEEVQATTNLREEFRPITIDELEGKKRRVRSGAGHAEALLCVTLHLLWCAVCRAVAMPIDARLCCACRVSLQDIEAALIKQDLAKSKIAERQNAPSAVARAIQVRRAACCWLVLRLRHGSGHWACLRLSSAPGPYGVVHWVGLHTCCCLLPSSLHPHTPRPYAPFRPPSPPHPPHPDERGGAAAQAQPHDAAGAAGQRR